MLPIPGTTGRIHLLDEDVVNKMAAGEIIIRPVQAIKELVENSLDACSSEILVSIRGGGFDRVSVQDNGQGIHPDDFPILAKRFSTSKLRTYSDLESLHSFGFRGEALASLTYVARVKVTSSTRINGEIHRRASAFRDGKWIEDLRGNEAPPLLLSDRETGTTIIFEDLFHNLPNRRIALSNENLEYRFIHQYIASIAPRYPFVKFSCRNVSANPSRSGGRSTLQTSCDLRSRIKLANLEDDERYSVWDEKECIQVVQEIYGKHIARELLPVEFRITHPEVSCQTVEVRGLISHPNTSTRPSEGAILLFLNGRLINQDNLKRRIEELYTPLLPKGRSCWVLLDISLQGALVDVNVHPSKRIVKIRGEKPLMDAIQQKLKTTLRSCNDSRSFVIKPSQPPTRPVDSHNLERRQSNGKSTPSTNLPYMIRCDPSQQSLKHFFRKPQGSLINEPWSQQLSSHPSPLTVANEKLQCHPPLLALGLSDHIESSPERSTPENDHTRNQISNYAGMDGPFDSNESMNEMGVKGRQDESIQSEALSNAPIRGPPSVRDYIESLPLPGQQVAQPPTPSCYHPSRTDITNSNDNQNIPVMDGPNKEREGMYDSDQWLTALEDRTNEKYPPNGTILNGLAEKRSDYKPLLSQRELLKTRYIDRADYSTVRSSAKIWKFIGAFNNSQSFIQILDGLYLVETRNIISSSLRASIAARIGRFSRCSFPNDRISLSSLLDPDENTKEALTVYQKECPTPDWSMDDGASISSFPEATLSPDYCQFLSDHFAIEITTDPEDGKYVTGFPKILGAYFPGQALLVPFFQKVLQASQLEEELPSVTIIVNALADLFAAMPLVPMVDEFSSEAKGDSIDRQRKLIVLWSDIIEYQVAVIKQAIQDEQGGVPGLATVLFEADVFQKSFENIAQLKDLYKVFERC